MIIVAGWVRVDPADRDAYLDGCRAVLESDEHLTAFRGGGPDDGQAAQILDAAVSKYRISAEEPP